MDKALYKKIINEFKGYKNTDPTKQPTWYIITDDGVRYNHIPPMSQIKLNETDSTLDCIHLETGNSPSPTMAIDRVSLDKIISVGAMFVDKKECENMLTGYGISDAAEREKLLTRIFAAPRY